MSDILTSIEENYSKFSKGQKLIADYITTHYEKAAFMTASKLGVTVGISESTVVRFATELGFDGYPKLQKAMQEMIRSKLTALQRMEVANERISNEHILETVLEADKEQISQTLEEIDQVSFNQVVYQLLNADKIYILGVRSAESLASFMGFYFNLMFENIKVLNTTGSSEMFEQVMRVKKGDVVIGISFPRYSKRTLKLIEFARKQGAKTIALTDSKASPLSEISDYSLFAKSDMASFADSLVAPLSVINALIAAIGREKSKEIAKTLIGLENIWEEYEVYNKFKNR